MLYTVNLNNYGNSPKVKLTGKGFQFHFNLNNIIYFEDGALLPNQDVELTPYFPTTAEQTELLSEYSTWCTQFKQEPNETLVNILSSTEYWKEVKHDEVDVEAAKFEDNLNKAMYFTSSLGFRCNGDRRTATNIAGLITAYDLPPNSGVPVTYRDYDNLEHSLTKEQLQTLYLEHLTNGNMLYQQKWQMEANIDAADSLDALKSLDLTFKMQDYTQTALAEVSLQSTTETTPVATKKVSTLKSLLNL